MVFVAVVVIHYCCLGAATAAAAAALVVSEYYYSRFLASLCYHGYAGATLQICHCAASCIWPGAPPPCQQHSAHIGHLEKAQQSREETLTLLANALSSLLAMPFVGQAPTDEARPSTR